MQDVLKYFLFDRNHLRVFQIASELFDFFLVEFNLAGLDGKDGIVVGAFGAVACPVAGAALFDYNSAGLGIFAAV